MRLPVDDEIYTVNAVWLGPPGKTLPFRARYVAYGVGAAVFVLVQMIERRLGIGFGFFALAYSLLTTVAITKLILRVVDHDRPVSAVLKGLVNEVSAPRATTRVTSATIRPARVRAVPARPGRTRPRGKHSAAAGTVSGDKT